MPARVQRLDHLLELAHLLAARPAAGEALVGREEAERVVAPVVAQALVGEEASSADSCTGSSSTAVTPSA